MRKKPSILSRRDLEYNFIIVIQRCSLIFILALVLFCLIASTGTSDTRYLFMGERFEPSLDMYDLRARFYDPKLGRFLPEDAFPGFLDEPEGMNKYAYANANPAAYHDPTGLWGFSIPGVLHDFGLMREVRQRVVDTWSAGLMSPMNHYYGGSNQGIFNVYSETRAAEPVMRGWIGSNVSGHLFGGLNADAVALGHGGDDLYYRAQSERNFTSRIEAAAENTQVAVAGITRGRAATSRHHRSDLMTYNALESGGEDIHRLMNVHNFTENSYSVGLFKAHLLAQDPLREGFAIDVYPTHLGRGPGVRRVLPHPTARAVSAASGNGVMAAYADEAPVAAAQAMLNPQLLRSDFDAQTVGMYNLANAVADKIQLALCRGWKVYLSIHRRTPDSRRCQGAASGGLSRHRTRRRTRRRRDVYTRKCSRPSPHRAEVLRIFRCNGVHGIRRL